MVSRIEQVNAVAKRKRIEIIAHALFNFGDRDLTSLQSFVALVVVTAFFVTVALVFF